MEPIISPWFFYWASTLDFLGKAIMLLGGLAAFITAIPLIALAMETPLDREEIRTMRRCILAAGIAVVLIFAGGAVPNKATIYQMAIAKNITVERVAQGEKVLKRVYQDILRIAEQAVKERK